MPEILLCGSEGEQFLHENALDIFGADDKRRGSVRLKFGQQMYRKFDASYADFWVHVRVAVLEGPQSSPVGGELVQIESAGETIARIYCPGSAGDAWSFRFDAAQSEGGALDQGVTTTHTIGEFVNYDIRVQTSGGNRTFSFYRNEVLRHRVTYPGTGEADAVLLQARANLDRNEEVAYQDVIVSDGLPTIGMELATLVPSAVGNYDAFTNDYTAIDDLGYSQSSTISTTAVGDRESWFFADPEFNLGDKVVYAVAITSVAQTDLAGTIADFQTFLRMGGVDYDSTGLGADNVAPNAYTYLFTQNPNTLAPWQQADLAGLECGVLTV